MNKSWEVPQMFISSNKEEIDHKLWNKIDTTMSIFLWGAPRVGKTHLAIAIAKEINKNSTLFISIINMLNDLKMAIQDKSRSMYKELSYISNIDVLILDDMGLEKQNDFSTEIIDPLIDNRYANLKQTIITTNLNPDSFQKLYGLRIWTRIQQTYQIVGLTGKPRIGSINANT